MARFLSWFVATMWNKKRETGNIKKFRKLENIENRIGNVKLSVIYSLHVST